MRRTVVLLALVGLAVVVSSTAAFAAINKVTCKAGAAVCKGTGKADAILGSAAGDSIVAMGGNDGITAAAGNDAVNGGTGNDVYHYNRARSGFDTVQDASGTDTVNLSGLVAPTLVNLKPGISLQPEVGIHNPLGATSGPFMPVFGPPISSVDWDSDVQAIENVVGGQSTDVMSGSPADNVLSGGDGNDTISTGLVGGNDRFSGGEGTDSLTISERGATVSGGNDSDFVFASNDLSGGFIGSARISGDAGDDTIFGAAGNDFLSGGKGRDFLGDAGGPSSSDVYGFERGFGADTVSDANGTNDSANLKAYSRSEILEVLDADLVGGFVPFLPDGNLDSLVIEFKDGSLVAFVNYYDNVPPSGLGGPLPGLGVVERIELKDGNVSAAALGSMSEEASSREEARIESLVAPPPEADEIPEDVEIPGITD